jgi:flagellar basal body-associated protein FliL
MAKEKNEIDSKPEPQMTKKTGMSMPMMVGVIVGIIAVNAVIIILLFNFLIVPSLNSDSNDNSGEKAKKEKAAEEAHKNAEMEKKQKFQSSGRITTNPKASAQFVVIDLGFEFAPIGEEEGEAKEGEGFEPGLQAKIKGTVTKTLGSMTAEELTARRDTLDRIFFKNLKQVFKEEKFMLHSVILQEFIIQ